MTGRALTVLAIVVILGAVAGVYLISRTPTAQEEERSVRAFVEEFGTKLKNVSLLADRTMVADAMQAQYGPYVAPVLLSEWQSDPMVAPGQLTSSPWPEKIEVTGITKKGSDFEVEADIVEVTNEGGGIGEAPTETARRPVTLTLEKNGSTWRITALTLGSYPGDGEWRLSEPSAQGLRFLYPQRLTTSFISAAEWPPLVERAVNKYACKEGSITAADGPLKETKKNLVDDREYCVTRSSEGAAGSTYRAYEYAFQFGTSTYRIAFTLRFPQCMNYDEPQQSACKAEQSSYDIDGLVDRIARSIQVTSVE
ncbi:MAG: hypothetical protein AAB908_00120 [Patescibacteria group bacterium]